MDNAPPPPTFDQWCTSVGVKDTSVQKMAAAEIDSMLDIEALTADGIEQLELSIGQTCVLKQAALRFQQQQVQQRLLQLEAEQQPIAAVPPVGPPAQGEAGATPSVHDLDQLVADIQAKIASTEGEPAPLPQGKTPEAQVPRPHEVYYVRPTHNKKVKPLDLNFYQFMTGNIKILERLMREEKSGLALEFVQYLAFLSKKATSFKSAAVVAFDDEFRDQVFRGEATFKDTSLMADLAAHHFDSDSRLANTPMAAGVALDKRPQGPGKTRNYGNKPPSTSSADFCLRWNMDTKAGCRGHCNYVHKCGICESTSHGLTHHRKQ